MLLEAIIVIILLTFILEVSLEYLNEKSAAKRLDHLVAGLYTEEERTRSIRYSEERNKLGLFSGALSTSAMLLALGFGWFADLDSLISSRVSNSIMASLLFIGSLSLISWFISLPFAFRRT